MSQDDVKFKWVDAEAEGNFKFGEASAEGQYRSDTGVVTSTNLVNVGTKAGLSILKVEKNFGDDVGVSAQGPSVSGDVGLQWNHERVGVNAMAEASVAKAKAKAGPGFLEANLNANTGAKIGTDGVKFGILGFGLTLGVGGRFSLDTPVGSVGGEMPDECTNTNTHSNTQRNVRYN